jgi:hypothetical protein
MYCSPSGCPVFPGLQNISSADKLIENLKLVQKRMKRDYDVKVRVRDLKPGDLVYQLDTATIKGKSRKLSPSW